MKECPKCFSKLQDNDHLCEYCGTIIDASSHMQHAKYELSFNSNFHDLNTNSLYKNIELNRMHFDFFMKLSNDKFIGISNNVLKSNLDFETQKNITVLKKLRYDGAIIHTHEALELNNKQAEYFINNESEIDFFGQDLASYLSDLNEEIDNEIIERYDFINIDDEDIINFDTLDEIDCLDWELDNAPPTILSNNNIDTELKTGLEIFFDNVISALIEKIDIDSGFEITSIKEQLEKFSIDKDSYVIVQTNKYNYSTTFDVVLRIDNIEGFNILDYLTNTKFIESYQTNCHEEESWWNVEPYLYESVLDLYLNHDIIKEISYISD